MTTYSFIGNAEARLDAKGRVFIPALFRKQLMSSAVIMQKDPYRKCLTFFPEEIWEERAAAFDAEMDEWNSEDSDLQDWFYDSVERLEIDTQGRTLIPKKFLEQIDAVADVAFQGQRNFFIMKSKTVSDADKLKVSDKDRARLLEERMKRKSAATQPESAC